MKRFFLLVASLFVSLSFQASAQERFNLPVSVIVADENVPAEARQSLTAKLKSMLTKNGFYVSDGIRRFVFTAKINVVSKDILPTNPPRISTKMDVTFFIGDVIDNRVYESCSIGTKGIGTNENKALISSFQGLSVQNSEIAGMLTAAKQSIAEYYRTNYKSILQKADVLSAKGEYDAAIYELESVPEIDTAIVSVCHDAMLSVWQKKIDDESAVLLRKARSEWMVDKSMESGKKAAKYIAGIDPFSSSADDADSLLNEIDRKLRQDEAAAAASAKEEKEYQRKAMEEAVAYARNMQQQRFEFEKEKHRDNQAFRNNVVSACRDVALEYAKNQPQTITNIITSW